MTVTAHINVETPAGRKLVRDLEKHRRLVQIEYSEPMGVDGILSDTKPLNEVYENGLDKLTNHYGVDMRKMKSKI